MADDAKEQSNPTPQLDVSLEDIGPARKCLTIQIPEGRITEKIESNYSRLHNDAVIPGFRKGRAPRKLIERRFGSSVVEDTRNQLLGECYTQAIEDHDLDVIGEPDIKDMEKIELPKSGPLEFKVEVEVSPKVELPDLKGIKINKPKLEVADKQVDEEIDRLGERLGKPIEDKDAKAKEKDFVKADIRILAGKDADEDAEEIIGDPEAWIMVHGKENDYKGHAAGIVVEQLGKKLTGKKSGDTVTVSMTGPTGHEHEKIKDQPITIRINVVAVERLEPASLDQIVKAWGVDSPEALRERIHAMLKDRNDRQQQVAMHEQICNHLLEKVELELPEGLTNRQTSRQLQRHAMELAYAGTDPQEIEQQIAEMRQEKQEKAVEQLKQFFILDQAAKNLNIEVSDSEVNGRIAMLAMQQNRRPEKLRHEMQQKGEIEHLFLQIREQKTPDKILEDAQITVSDAPTEKVETKAKAPAKKTKKTTKKKQTKET